MQRRLNALLLTLLLAGSLFAASGVRLAQIDGTVGFLGLTGGARIGNDATDSDDLDSPVALTSSSDLYQFGDVTSGDIEYDLPALSGVDDGFTFVFTIMAGTNQITLDPNASEEIVGSTTSFSFSTVGTSISIRAKTSGANQGWWIQ